jgi:hypothetical protein
MDNQHEHWCLFVKTTRHKSYVRTSIQGTHQLLVAFPLAEIDVSSRQLTMNGYCTGVQEEAKRFAVLSPGFVEE